MALKKALNTLDSNLLLPSSHPRNLANLKAFLGDYNGSILTAKMNNVNVFPKINECILHHYSKLSTQEKLRVIAITPNKIITNSMLSELNIKITGNESLFEIACHFKAFGNEYNTMRMQNYALMEAKLISIVKLESLKDALYIMNVIRRYSPQLIPRLKRLHRIILSRIYEHMKKCTDSKEFLLMLRSMNSLKLYESNIQKIALELFVNEKIRSFNKNSEYFENIAISLMVLSRNKPSDMFAIFYYIKTQISNFSPEIALIIYDFLLRSTPEPLKEVVDTFEQIILANIGVYTDSLIAQKMLLTINNIYLALEKTDLFHSNFWKHYEEIRKTPIDHRIHVGWYQGVAQSIFNDMKITYVSEPKYKGLSFDFLFPLHKCYLDIDGRVHY